MPNLSRDAQIVGSAQYHFLDDSSAFQKFLIQNGQAGLYDSGSEMRLQKWIEAQPNFFRYVRDKKIQFDVRRNMHVSRAARMSNREANRQLKALISERHLTELEGLDLSYHDDGDNDDEEEEEVEEADSLGRPQNGASEASDPINPRAEEHWFNRFTEKYFGPSGSDLKGLSAASKCAGCNNPSVLHERTQTFTCLLCTDSILCRDCYHLRKTMNEVSQPGNETSFCCDGGQYLEIPVAGWQGFQGKKLHIEGEEPIEWEEYLRGVKTQWEMAWADFWRG